MTKTVARYHDDDEPVLSDVIDLAARLSGPVWQPIETAPKDGTKIIVFNGYQILIAAHAQHKIKAASTPWLEGSPLGRQMYRDPTHWMPLPEPPESP